MRKNIRAHFSNDIEGLLFTDPVVPGPAVPGVVSAGIAFGSIDAR
jgi:hypothetical protein